MLEWLGSPTELLKGASFLTVAILATTTIVIQMLRNQPVNAKAENEARKSLDKAVQVELRRLSDRVDHSEQKHLECEERNLELQREHIETVKRFEDQLAGMRRQLIQYQQTVIERGVATAELPPAH